MKLVAARGQAWELYDLSQDPTEEKNLASAKPDQARELEKLWQTWANRVGAKPWPVLSLA